MAIPNRVWRRWHRWTGLLVAIPLLVLSITGLLLNHLDDFRLRERPLPLWLAQYYGVPPLSPALASAPVEQDWWLWADRTLFRDQQPLAECAEPFSGVVAVGALRVAGCGRTLLLFSAQGELLERIGSDYGVPLFAELGSAPSGVLLATATGTRLFNPDSLRLSDWQDDWQPQSVVLAPPALAQQLPRQRVPVELNWERLLLDIHAGRVLPFAGTLLMDLSALLLLALAGSGIWIWWRTR